MNPKSIHCFEASESMLYNYFCTKQVPRGTFYKYKYTLKPPKIWCILLEQQSQGPWIRFTSLSEVKSSFPLQRCL